VTLFNRGKSNPGLFPQLEKIIGDREKEVNKLDGRIWDAVIDVAGYVPRIVRLSAEVLKENVSCYVFISSISVYDEAILRKIGIDESDPVAKMEDETVEEITGETYGPLKALCEQAVQQIYGERALIIRPGLIVGPHDPTDRFTYWPMRVARGGEVLAPEKPDAPAQIIDVRDLSDFIIRLIQDNASGIYNATGPDYALTLGEILEASNRVSGSDVHISWAPVDFLKQHNVGEWIDMPVWVPDSEENQGFSRVDVSKAIHAGLKFRPLEETIRDTLAWAQTRPADYQWRAGLTAEREAEVLAALKGA
jgi:2'-hydroxyisoflavone reductase